ncbi:MAG: hypothetical protein Q8T13_15560 [Acidobacteriota bacterium]|nr:hypothetical protein [Acidobacteriota bacterium]
MPTPRVIPHAVLLIVLAGTASLQAQAPPSLGVGSRIRVTRADGGTYTGVVAPKPAGPLWAFVTADGKPVNFLISELLSVRLLGRDVTLKPGWSYSSQTFAWAAVQTTDGQALELGIHRWPGFNIIRDDTGLVEVNNLWANRLSAVAAVTRPATKPGLATGARALVTRSDGSYEGTVFLDPKQKSAFAFVRLDTKEQWKLRLQDIHRLTATGRREGGLDVVEVEMTDAQVYTVAVYSRSAFDLERADTGRREVNTQSYAAFKSVQAIDGSATAVAPEPLPPATDAAVADTLRAAAVARYEEYLKTSRPEALGDAAALAERLVDALPNDGRAWLLLGQLYRELPPEPMVLALAEDAFAHAVAVEPALAEARLALGLSLFDQGLYDAALEHFETVLQADVSRGLPWVVARMTEAYLRDEQLTRGAAFWRGWLARWPEADTVRLAFAIILDAQGLGAQARSELRQVSERAGASPANRAFARTLGDAMAHQGGRP